MCRNLIVTNELFLGSRQLGYELYSLPKGEVVEFTEKQLRDCIIHGKDEVYGVIISEDTGELIPDEQGFYCRNWMIKSHINSLVPKYEGESLVNLFYIVVGTHKEKGNTLYDVISSRYERTSFSEDKVRTLYDMGVISAGLKLDGEKIVVAPLEKEKTPVQSPVQVEKPVKAS